MGTTTPLIAGFLIIASLLVHAEPTESKPLPRNRYLLIERKPLADGEAETLGDLAIKEIGIKKDSELGRFLSAPKWDRWKTFEDADVRFDYPDFPGIKVVPSEKRLAPGTEVYGGPVGSVNRRSSRYYSIQIEKVTWAIVMLQDEPWFDDGICLCGAVALRAYVPNAGCLRAYDLLVGGDLKKMQVLGDGKRLQVFEWTHLPMAQETYLRFTESVALKHPSPKTEADWRADFRKLADKRQTIGWLKPGDKEADVIALLGQPKRHEANTLIYEEPNWDNTVLIIIRIALRNGVFQGFRDDWITGKDIPPTPGTLRWAKKLTAGESRTASPEELAQLKKSCLENLKSCPADHWNEWVQVASELNEQGWKPKELGPLVVSRFLEPKVAVNWASTLIGELQPPGTQEAVLKRIRMELDGAAKPEMLKNQYLPSTLDQFHNLLCQVDDKKARQSLILEGLAHPHRGIRFSAFGWLDKIPALEALAAARKGLDDSDEYVRRDSAEAFSKDLGSKEDLPLLKDHAKKEKNESVNESLAEAIKRLGGMK